MPFEAGFICVVDDHIVNVWMLLNLIKVARSEDEQKIQCP